MSARTITQRARRRQRLITISWIAVLAAITITLIYTEQTALLYVLATLGVTLLLVIVAKADLAHAEPASIDPATNSLNNVDKSASDWGSKKRV